jgi:outer membrane lipoprotein-sorting protein
MRLFFLISGLCGLLWTPAYAALTAAQILAKSDAIRMPSGDYEVNAKVVVVRPRGTQDAGVYDILIKGHDKTLIKTLSPKTDRGTSILMVDHDLWVFLTDVSKPVRVSLQQRLMGDVANGDLARANFIDDYTPALVDQKPTFYVLDLKAKSDEVTYSSIRLWVERPTFRPLRAAFYSVSGKLLKVGSYEDFRELAGVSRPSRLVLSNALVKGQTSTIFYNQISRRNDLPEKLFTKDYLKKLKY